VRRVARAEAVLVVATEEMEGLSKAVGERSTVQSGDAVWHAQEAFWRRRVFGMLKDVDG
jgi:hypothetical protein